MSRKKLYGGIEKIAENSGGPLTQQFLQECQCYSSAWDEHLMASTLEVGKPCKDIETYEASRIVVYKGLDLQDKLPESEMAKLSSIKDEYTSLLLTSIDVFFPEIIMDKKDPNRRKEKDKMDSLQTLDHRYWKKDAPLDEEMFRDAFKFLLPNRAKEYVPIGVINNFKELRARIMLDNDFFCEASKSKPTSFWTQVLRKYDDIDGQIVEMVQVALTMPLGSASAERSFR